MKPHPLSVRERVRQRLVLRVGSGKSGVGTCGAAAGHSGWTAAYHSEHLSVNPFFGGVSV